MLQQQPEFRSVFRRLLRFHKDRLFVVGMLPYGGGAPICATFNRTASEDDFARWCEQYPAHDLCQVLNEPGKPVDKKPKESDIANVHYIVVDFDLLSDTKPEDADAVRRRIIEVLTADRPEGVPHPTVIEQANGIKAYWQLAAPYGGDVEAFKLRVIGLENDFKKKLEGVCKVDSCRAVEHLFRCAGIICRKPDRADVLVVCIEDHLDDAQYIYGLDRFPPAPAGASPASNDQTTVNTDAARKAHVNLDTLPAEVKDDCKAVILHGHDPLDPQKFGDDRSRWLMRVVTHLVRAGVDDQTIYNIITDPGYPISASVLDKGSRTDKYAKRQIQRAREAAADFIKNDNGRIFPENQHNMRLAIAKLGVSLRYNSFANRMLIERDSREELLNDQRTTDLWFEIDRTFGFRPGYQLFDRFTSNECWRNPFHPVRDYLDSLQWDGTPRIDRWLTTYGGADDTDFNRAVGRIVLIAAVRRIRKPGVKFDEMLILESSVQGKNKSTALQVLAVKPAWFNDTLPLSSDVNRKVEAMQGRWIVEAGELSGMSEAGVAKLKNFLSSQTDCTRLAWEKKPDEYPRQCIIIGTTNQTADVLTDETGNRRYWPVKIQNFDIAKLTADHAQLWAEAAHLEAAGESIRLDPKLYSAASEQQEKRREVSPMEQKLSPLFGPGKADGRIPADKVWEVLEVSTLEVKQRLGRAVGKIMQAFGWQRKQLGSEGRYFYVRGEDRDLFPQGSGV